MATHKIIVEKLTQSDQSRHYTLDRNMPNPNAFAFSLASIMGVSAGLTFARDLYRKFQIEKFWSADWETIESCLVEMLQTSLYAGEDDVTFVIEMIESDDVFGSTCKDSKVNPSHYTSNEVTPIDLIKAYDLNFNLGNVIKYTARAKQKNGREDLCKAVWSLAMNAKRSRDTRQGWPLKGAFVVGVFDHQTRRAAGCYNHAMLTPICFDGYKGDNIDSFHAMKDAGIEIVFLKASEGATYKDPTFRARADRAKSVGMHVGGFHFLNNEHPYAQLANYLECLEPGELMALDMERYDAHPEKTTTVPICEKVATGLQRASTRFPVGYCGSWLMEQEMKGLIAANSILRLLPGWGYRYSEHFPPLIHGMDLVMHQYTGDGVGPLPHRIPGCSNDADLSVWVGNKADIPAFAAKHCR